MNNVTEYFDILNKKSTEKIYQSSVPASPNKESRELRNNKSNNKDYGFLSSRDPICFATNSKYKK